MEPFRYNTQTCVYFGRNSISDNAEQLKELAENCRWVYDKKRKGYDVIGPNGKSIFLPAGGWYDKTTLNNKTTYGSYWTATGDGGTANAVDFVNNDKDKALVPRCEGRSVRPVKD